jgi:2-C-methyl-D-erythritol 2,4-cyclodiphosphate synthase
LNPDDLRWPSPSIPTPVVSVSPCILAVVTFAEMTVGPDGHSGADVVAHAAIDDPLGAADLADIGTHFLDTDLQDAGAASLELLRRRLS